MAEKDNFESETNVSGIYFPQDYSINALNFITAAKQKFDLRKLVIEFSFFEDIYSFCVSGNITLVDAQGFVELFQLTGNEYLEIDVGKTKNAKGNIKNTYRVYKLSSRIPLDNMTSEMYTLHFCSEELLLSEQNKISGSYKGKKVSDNVRNILTEKLRVPNKKIVRIEDTYGVLNLIMPKVKPFEGISWLSNYARPQANQKVGADMLFFETRDGFNFRSLQSMYKDGVYASYNYEAKNLGDDRQSFQAKTTTVLNYEIIKSYDVLNEINSGTYANRLISLDPLTRTFKITDYSYTNYKEKGESLNKGAVTNQIKNRLGKTATQSYESVLKVATSNASQIEDPYVKGQNTDVKDVFIENNVPNRTAQIALANYTVLKIAIPGDTGITAGRTIQFNLYSLKPATNVRELDRFYSGKYLVSAVRHVISSPSTFQTILEIVKDSSETNYVKRDENSAQSKSISGSTDYFNSIAKIGR